MTISVGDKLPEATLLRMGDEGPEQVALAPLLSGRKVVIFGLPGAFTGTCTSAHLPSFMRNKEAFAKKGVDEIICLSVNDPFVMQAWADSTGADEAGIILLGDSTAELTKAMGMDFTAPPAGLIDRSKRYAMLVEDGVVKVLNIEENPGVCEASAGETLLEQV
ncbi:peroxiredoxin [Rhodobacteraceae bacterium W635]|uniref:peroxiredoxin n=1 Tax=Nioella halotolerans TaxID=2303578 RepID=UPI000E3D8237|nr:peroxiredoxin [Rhodobacteraceae bacterium W635]